MSNQHPRHVRAPIPGRPRPIEQLHPVLLHIIMRMDVMPPGDRESITEEQLARAVSLAISMMPDDEQTYMVSRIMTDDEIAEQRLNSLEVQDLGRRVNLSADERRLLLRGSPAPEDEDEGEDDNNSSTSNDNDNLCIVCSGTREVTVPCGCHYCTHCLRANIRTGLRSEMDFPPRCCRPFNEAVVGLAQRPALVHLFRQLSTEYAVPVDLRVYCHDASCSSFIPPSAIEAAPDDEDDATAAGTCPSCGTETCAECGNRSHRGLPCREEEDEEALWDMMDDQGCICHEEFCYLCGHAWRTCSCPLYGSFHLLVPTRQRPGRRPVARGGRAHLAEATERTLRVPQLRYDPDDEIALAAVEGDVAPLDGLDPVAADDGRAWRERPVADSDSDGEDSANAAVAPRQRNNAGQMHRRADQGHPQALQQRQHNPPRLPEPLMRNEARDDMNDLIHRAFDQMPHLYDPFRRFDRPIGYMGPVPQHPPRRADFEYYHQDGYRPRPFRGPYWEAAHPQPMPNAINYALQQLHIGEMVYNRHFDQAQQRPADARMQNQARNDMRGAQQRPEHGPGPQPRAQAAPRPVAQQQYGDGRGVGEAARQRRARERSNRSRERRASERERRRSRDGERRRDQGEQARRIQNVAVDAAQAERLRQRFERRPRY
ncbi:hypothetical protein ACHAQJ_008824 [Trichoderma viride]